MLAKEWGQRNELRVERLCQRVLKYGVGRYAVGLAFKVEDQAVAEDGDGDGAEVFAGDMEAVVDDRQDFGGEDDGLRAAGAAAVANETLGEFGCV